MTLRFTFDLQTKVAELHDFRDLVTEVVTEVLHLLLLSLVKLTLYKESKLSCEDLCTLRLPCFEER